MQRRPSEHTTALREQLRKGRSAQADELGKNKAAGERASAHARTHARTHPRTRAPTHARTHANARMPERMKDWLKGRPGSLRRAQKPVESE